MKNLGVVVALIVGLALGYFAGREHLKYEIRSEFSSAAEELRSGLTEAFGSGSSSSPRVTGSKPEIENNGAADIAKRENKNAYIKNNLTLYGVTSKYYDSVLDGKVPGVDFKIKNNGDQALSRVEVTIYFKDESDAVIFEKSFLPVLVSEYSFSGNNDPLKPGYIWQQERGHFYSAKDVPSEWSEGNVEAEITRIEFFSTPE